MSSTYGEELNLAPLGPETVFAVWLRVSGGKNDGFSVSAETSLCDAVFGVDGVDEASVLSGEKCGVPCALRLAACHEKM
jgi:hypothetical protein